MWPVTHWPTLWVSFAKEPYKKDYFDTSSRRGCVDQDKQISEISPFLSALLQTEYNWSPSAKIFARGLYTKPNVRDFRVSLGTSVAFFKIGTDLFPSVTWYKCVDVYV